jgi:histidinol-phosphatase (PHP family)
MKFDLHTHHDRCGHAIGKIQDYIESAIKNELKIIGISDHSPFFASKEDQLFPGIAMGKSEFPHYVSEVLRLKEAYQDKIEVLLGVESDFFPEQQSIYKEIYEQYPLDYIIGSVHISNELSIFKKGRWEGLSEEEHIKEKEIYYDLIRQSAQSGMFDILGHIDAMKGFYPRFSDIKTDAVDHTLKAIAEADVSIEINTSGKTKDCGGWYPAEAILERACFYGVKVSFGSDSHTPERVGDDFEEVRSLLKQIGFKEWSIFRKRERVLIPI